MAIKCPKCNVANPDTVKFCGECGTQLPSSRDIHPEVTETLQTPIKELTTGSNFAGRYQIIEALGHGGMGRVYRVLDKKLNEEVALKLIKPEIASDKETIKRFSNELRLARRIGHRNVGRMYELMEDEGAHFITMEYVSGEDLKSFIHRVGQLPIGKAISIAKQICDGLAEAHGLGVVHRDLKPSNIMIDKDGNARIMDFGIARSLQAKGITGAGVIIGTPEYMSPEQAEAKEVDKRSDIYSLGVIFFEMVTGRVPFEGETPLSIVMKHKGEIPKDPKQFNPIIPDDLSNVILRCLEKDRAKRYQTAVEVRSELEKIEKGIPTTERVVPERKTLTSREITVKFSLKKLLWPGLAVILIITFGLVLWQVLRVKKAPPAAEKSPAKIAGFPDAKNSIAVLPFVDLSPAKEYEYLAEGIAETLINALSTIPDLRVPARTSAFSFKDKSADIKEIGQKLGVTTVLEGSIQVSRNRLRVTSQLININDGFHLWSEKYDRNMEDVFAIQDDIAQRIVGALKIKLLGERATQIIKHSTLNPEAYNLYAQGLYVYNRRGKENLEKAVEYLKRAIEMDPKYALAYAQLAETYAVIGEWGFLSPREAFPRAKEAAQKALEIDDSLAEAHCALAQVKYLFEWDWQSAEAEFKKSLSLNPNYAIGHMQYGEFLMCLRRFDEAVQEMKLAQRLDPLSLIIRIVGALPLEFSGQIDLAIAEYEDVLKMDPNFMPAQEYLYRALFLKYLAKGMYKEALEVSRKSNDQSRMALVYAKTGKTSEANKILESLIAGSEQQPVLSYYIAELFFALGVRDQGFQWLEKACEYRHRMLAFSKISPILDTVRDDPRFLAMLKKIGLEK